MLFNRLVLYKAVQPFSELSLVTFNTLKIIQNEKGLHHSFFRIPIHIHIRSDNSAFLGNI